MGRLEPRRQQIGNHFFEFPPFIDCAKFDFTNQIVRFIHPFYQQTSLMANFNATSIVALPVPLNPHRLAVFA